jgi:hypothetical protein
MLRFPEVLVPRAGWLARSLILLLLVPAGLRAATATVTQVLQVSIGAQASFSTASYSVSLGKTGTLFNNFTGTLTLLYRGRTGSSVTTAGITVKARSDFAPSGGPSIGSPPSAGDALNFTCSGATLGTGCSGTQSMSMTAAKPVVTFPASACTGTGSPCNNADPNSVTLNFTLSDDPKYKTGSYTTTLQFTISAI